MKNLMKLLFAPLFFLNFVLAAHAHAAGILTLSGKLISITPKAFIVRTEIATYSVKRSAVERSVAEKIDRPEVPVKFTVPFGAIDKVKPLRQ